MTHDTGTLPRVDLPPVAPDAPAPRWVAHDRAQPVHPPTGDRSGSLPRRPAQVASLLEGLRGRVRERASDGVVTSVVTGRDLARRRSHEWSDRRRAVVALLVMGALLAVAAWGAFAGRSAVVPGLRAVVGGAPVVLDGSDGRAPSVDAADGAVGDAAGDAVGDAAGDPRTARDAAGDPRTAQDADAGARVGVAVPGDRSVAAEPGGDHGRATEGTAAAGGDVVVVRPDTPAREDRVDAGRTATTHVVDADGQHVATYRAPLDGESVIVAVARPGRGPVMDVLVVQEVDGRPLLRHDRVRDGVLVASLPIGDAHQPTATAAAAAIPAWAPDGNAHFVTDRAAWGPVVQVVGWDVTAGTDALATDMTVIDLPADMPSEARVRRVVPTPDGALLVVGSPRREVTLDLHQRDDGSWVDRTTLLPDDPARGRRHGVTG